MTTHTATATTTELPKVSESTVTVLQELSGIAMLFVCAAIPTVILALRWAA